MSALSLKMMMLLLLRLSLTTVDCLGGKRTLLRYASPFNSSEISIACCPKLFSYSLDEISAVPTVNSGIFENYFVSMM